MKWIIIFGVLLVILLSVVVTGGNAENSETQSENSVFDGLRAAHTVIRINNDTEFINEAQQEGWPGSGSIFDPYVIENYEINATSHTDGIYIGNTTLWFIIRNCMIYNAYSYNINEYFRGAGIIFNNVSNGGIINNTLHSNYEGIAILSSPITTVQENNIYDNEMGIDVVSDHTTYYDNYIHDNGVLYGILVRECNNNTFTNNTLVNNSIEIYGMPNALYAQNNEFKENKIINGSFIIDGGIDTFATQDIQTSNTVNGKAVYYYRNANMNNATVPQDAGEVILGNVSYLIIENLDLSRGAMGIEIGYSSNITIRNNKIYNQSEDCIYLYFLHNSSIVNNSVSHSDKSDIYVDSSDNNTIANNNLSYAEDGIDIDSSHNNTIMNNTISDNHADGIYLIYSNSNSIYNNTISHNYLGIDLYYSDNNRVVENLISNNIDYGVSISFGAHNKLYNNSFYYNAGSGDSYVSSHIQAYDDGTDNMWNTSGNPHGYGNYWRDWSSPDNNDDGIVDSPYQIDGSANAKDYYPLTNATQPIPELPNLTVLIPVFEILLVAAIFRRK